MAPLGPEVYEYRVLYMLTHEQYQDLENLKDLRFPRGWVSRPDGSETTTYLVVANIPGGVECLPDERSEKADAFKASGEADGP